MNAEGMEPKTALQLVLERLPKTCPACASLKVAPVFEDNWFDCADCAHTWEYR